MEQNSLNQEISHYLNKYRSHENNIRTTQTAFLYQTYLNLKQIKLTLPSLFFWQKKTITVYQAVVLQVLKLLFMVNKLLFSFILISFFLGFNINNVSASHIPGANLTWTCNPSNPLEYTFTLTLFRACPASNIGGAGTSPDFTFTNTCSLTNPVAPQFAQVGTAIDVNQLCPSALSNCTGGY